MKGLWTNRSPSEPHNSCHTSCFPPHRFSSTSGATVIPYSQLSSMIIALPYVFLCLSTCADRPLEVSVPQSIGGCLSISDSSQPQITLFSTMYSPHSVLFSYVPLVCPLLQDLSPPILGLHTLKHVSRADTPDSWVFHMT